MMPLLKLKAAYPAVTIDLGSTTIMEPFNVVVQMCVLGGLALSMPFILYFVGRFVAPALTEKELRAVLPLCVSAFVLFLLGAAFAKTCGMTLLPDTTVLEFAGQRWLLSHGDALCLADTDYMKFRAQVRSPAWQHDFLAQPLAHRQETARHLRAQSESRKRSALTYADLDAQATCDYLHRANATTLIHGHTHQPAVHTLSGDHQRLVLSDWDASATPARGQWLTWLRGQGFSRQTLKA